MRAMQQLLESSNILNHVPLPMMLTAPDAKVLWWSEEAERTFGYTANEIVGRFFPFDKEERSTIDQLIWNQAFQSEDPISLKNFSLQSKQGEIFNASAILNSVTLDNEQFVMVVFEVDNLQTIYQTTSAQELASLKTGIDKTFMITNLDVDGLITYGNELFLKSSKWTPKRVIGKSFWQLFPVESAEKLVNQIWYALKSNRVWQGSVEKLTKDGDTYWVDMTAIPVLSTNDEPLYFTILEKDITEKKRLQMHLEQIAYVDPETGLMNRHRLEKVVFDFIKEERHFSFIFLDIDKFYTLKDVHDDESETTLLLEFSKRLKMYFQDSDIARVGEDEFVVLTSLSDWFTQGFLSYLKQHPIYIRSKAIPISISGGITRYPEDQLTFSHMMKASIVTVHKVQQEGGGNIVSLSQANHKALSKKALIEKRLIEALHHKDLTVMYQPQIDLSTGKIDAVEALVRWEDAVLGTVPPNELIPVAEESGMIHDIGSFMLEKACEQAALWSRNGKPMKISVNSSIREFRDNNMVKKVRQALDKYNCPAHLLKIEITEKFALEAESEQSIIRQMLQLQNDGIVFILDDFGTGYASFRYMQLLPISELKIDQSFIAGLLQQEKPQKLVHGMIQFGKSMDIRVIAEGVETKEQLDLLKKLGCDAVQGFYISYPVAASEIDIQ
ncbi:bifunctional diguanylate cyclase/phosphodiesterase [Paenisporosarcina antarctica]|uniref:Bifunctional diguanylate cyclase/phosphodiesterase n=1 Tax=Paenisporosarcina antarctica TaxID=417367 RepID=A0A4P7A0A4_9BACL|nr:bifunctional diguanylate cyclase/phosphodiesterase [Paenisporosarcina antarctica]QBP42202.1 bifunctional diguanylate cyclase/phosphodiesterase [Paenisporosarcina antarctica]